VNEREILPTGAVTPSMAFISAEIEKSAIGFRPIG
jgi:hypothetical protein